MTEVTDLRGEIVRTGDTIAYAATDGRSGGLRVGKVVEIVESHEKFDRWDKEKQYPSTVPTKLKVTVEHSSGYSSPGRPTLIDATLKRFVKVGL